MRMSIGLVLVTAIFTSVFLNISATNYYVGVGIFDITGPAAEVNMMGYANPAQTSHGIHLRQFSRAFIFSTSSTGKRVVFISIDACWASGAVKQNVVKKLSETYGNMYTAQNLVLSGTHTHSGSGGFSQYLLYDITALGFNKQGFDALVEGITQSVIMAHKSMQPADIYMNSGELLDSNINRSPSAYLNNPAQERAKYKYDVDKTMTILKIVNAQGQGIGMISWFAVHCTSMNNTNEMLSSDNKGYASMLFEADMNPGTRPGQGQFVAAFAQSNEGDVSPNTKGPHCIDSGKPCDILTSTCHGKNELCIASGPGKDMFESTQIIARNQYKKATDLYNSAKIKLNGPVDFRHTYVDMTKQNVTLPDGSIGHTCKTSMGYSFAAGTTDGPGAFDFKQGTNTTNPFWNFVRDLIKDPSPELVKCQAPKPILLATGEISFPYKWQPDIVDHQLLRLGQFIITAVPGEFSTMSGRRMRDVVQAAAVQGGMPADTVTVIAGLANEYADYITTFEEYQIQRYEGASTIYGQHTLSAYLQSYSHLSSALAKNLSLPAGPSPPDLLDKQISLLPGVVFDSAPAGKQFGSVVKDAAPSYAQGSTVTVEFC
ncbi:LOW QUALITY PROTEIN: neutral ceramidase-like [Plakobranchus ocellatus]|uniref:Neutral ceramidase n=1 Tax=Plakobranchus ocellatus TaxID=259542 RepID=A0AAV4B1A3_9GAST|nr:LOW QUALITY PROTEIN: neutral ceramidase-like [Plakobranchus ocellatus]